MEIFYEGIICCCVGCLIEVNLKVLIQWCDENKHLFDSNLMNENVVFFLWNETKYVEDNIPEKRAFAVKDRFGKSINNWYAQ